MIKFFMFYKAEFDTVKKERKSAELARTIKMNQRTVHRYLQKEIYDVPFSFIARLEKCGVIRPIHLFRKMQAYQKGELKGYSKPDERTDK